MGGGGRARNLEILTSDPRENYISLISLDKSHVDLSVPIIFLFGGAIGEPSEISKPPKSDWTSSCIHVWRKLKSLSVQSKDIVKKPSGNTNTSKSIREILYNHILMKHSSLSRHLVMPEEFKDWLHDSVYPDLVTFESDLAQTSSLVIIALESPGAIAELGSFSVNDTLKHKVFIIISEHHHNQQSFITLGPLRQLPEENVLAYPYNHILVGDTFNEYLDDVVHNINENLGSLKKTEKFDANNNGHVAHLIFELVLIFKALKLTEIKNYLEKLSINYNQAQIRRLLFLLEKLAMLTKERLGNIDYYVPLQAQSRIDISSKDKDKRFDRNAVVIGTSQYYALSELESMRRKVIRRSQDRIK